MIMWRDLTMQLKSDLMQMTGIFDPIRLRLEYDAYHMAKGGHVHLLDGNINVLKVNDEGLPEYTLPEVTIAYDLPDRNLDKQGFNKYIDSFVKSYTDGNINISDINRLPFLYRNATLGKIGSTRKLKMSSDSVKRKEFEDIQKKIKKYSPSYPTGYYKLYRDYWLWNNEIDELNDIENRMAEGAYWNVDEMLLDLNKYELIVSKRQNYKDAIKERDDYLSNYAGRYLNSRIPFVDPFKEDANSLPSLLFRYAKRHNLFGLNENKHVSLESKEMVGGKGTDIISLDNNVIRLSPESKQSSALFNEFVETLNPSIYRASDYKLGNVSAFGDSHIPTENVSLFLGVEDGKFKIGNIKDFKDDTYVYPVRNIKKLYSAPIKKISVILNGQEGISKDYVGLLRQKVSYKTPYDEMIMDFYDLYDPWGGTKKESEAHWNSYRSTENIKYALKKHPEAAKYIIYKDKAGYTYNEIMLLINDGAFSDGNLWFEGRTPNYIYAAFDKARNNYPETKKLKEMYDKKFNELLEDTDNPYHTINEIRANLELERTKAYNDFIEKHPGLAPLENRENKYLVTDINDSTYNVSNLNASILDNKMVLGNPNGGVFIGRFLDISQPLLDSLNAYLQKNPSWISRNDLGSFDQYRLDSPSLGEYLKQYYENPSPNDPNVYVVGTTQPNKLWSNSYLKGGRLYQSNGFMDFKSPKEILAEKYGVKSVVDNVRVVQPVITVGDKKDYEVALQYKRKLEMQRQFDERTPVLKADVVSLEDRNKYRNQAEWNRIMNNANEAATNFGYSIGANHPMTIDEVNANTLGALETMGWYTNPALFGALVSSYQLGTGRPGAAALTAGMSVIPETSRLINNTNLAKSLTFANELRKNVNSTILDRPVQFNTPLNSTNTIYINTPRLNLGSLKFFERPSYLTEAEIQGIPRVERNQIVKGKSNWPVREVLKKGNYITKDTDNVIDLSSRRFGESEEAFLNAKFSQERWLGHKNRTNFEDALSDELGSTDLIQRYIRLLPDEIDQRFLNDNGLQSFYVLDFRQYLGDLGYETTNLSNEDIAKLLTDQYKMLSAGLTGFLKGDIVFHSGPEFVLEFDFANTGKNTGNMGYLGPGNYFSTEPSSYGLHGNTTMPSFSFGSDYYRPARRQPFLITDIKSMPTSLEIKKLGIIPEYTSPPNSVLNNPIEKQKYIDEFIKPIIDNTKLRDIAVVDDISYYPHNLFTSSPQLEFMVPRNSGIKSLYPHPSLFVENKDGSISLIRNWLDNRVNFSKGGSIHIKPENRGKFTALKKRTGHSASWFKAHGTPALKKMATFALNARKWKHLDGGYLDNIVWDQDGYRKYSMQDYPLMGIVGNNGRVDISTYGMRNDSQRPLFIETDMGDSVVMKPNQTASLRGNYAIEHVLQDGGLASYMTKSQIDNALYIWDYLIGLGFTPRNAAVIMGNSMQESSLNPNAKNPNSSARGYLLMIDAERKKSDAWSKQNGFDKDLGLFMYVNHLINNNIDAYTDEYNRVSKNLQDSIRVYNLNPTEANKKRMQENLNYHDTVYGKRISLGRMFPMSDLMSAWNNPDYDINKLSDLFEETIERAGSGAEHEKRRLYSNDILDYFAPHEREVMAYRQDPLNYIDGKLMYDLNANPITYQYGGLIKPFSYTDIPVVRYDNGGNLFLEDLSEMKVLPINQEGIPEYTLPEVLISSFQPLSLKEFSPYKNYFSRPNRLKKDFKGAVKENWGRLVYNKMTNEINNAFNSYIGDNKQRFDDLQEASGFFNQYVNSQIYLQRLENAGVNKRDMRYRYPKIRVVGYNPNGAYNGGSSITIPLYFNYGDMNAGNDEILVHEMTHSNPLFNSAKPFRWIRGLTDLEILESPYYGNDYSNIPLRWKELLKPENPMDEHDAELNESYSDLQALRYILYKNGVWNSLNPLKDFGEDEYNRLLELKDNNSIVRRYLRMHDKQKTIDAINEIAQNNIRNSDFTNYASYGGFIK